MDEATKTVPVGVKIISILYFIGAAFIVVAGLFSMSVFGVAGLSIGELFSLVVMAIFIGIVVLYFFVGRGLWKGQNWARAVAVIFSGLGILGGIFQLIGGAVSGAVGITIPGLIAWYLIFSKEVGEFFS